MSYLPKVVIVGRPNVGKSSLLNTLAERRVSIVDPTAGVTRDRVSVRIPIHPEDERPSRGRGRNKEEVVSEISAIELIDTGGYGIEDSQDLTTDVEQQIAFGVSSADLILFVVDAQSGLVPLDRTIAQLLRTNSGVGAGKKAAPILLVANKVDGESLETLAIEAAQLGFGMPLSVSANTKRGLFELREEIEKTINESVDLSQVNQTDEDNPLEEGMLLAIVGKRNAGKSTFVNALADEERVIVSDVEGTTRDSVDVRFEVDGNLITAIDTAGLRKRKSIQNDIEYYSTHRSLRAIRRADVCLFIVDAAVPISMVDKQLASEILKHHKPVVIVINKWDLAEQQHTQDEYVEYLDDLLKGLSFAPIVFLSAKNKDGIQDALAMAINLYEQSKHRVTTGQLNRLMEDILAERTPISKVGKRPKVYYVTQLDTEPPTIGFFVNDPDLFDGNYQRFILNRLRDTAPFSEVPIKLAFRTRSRMPAEIRAQQKNEAQELFSKSRSRRTGTRTQEEKDAQKHDKHSNDGFEDFSGMDEVDDMPMNEEDNWQSDNTDFV